MFSIENYKKFNHKIVLFRLNTKYLNPVTDKIHLKHCIQNIFSNFIRIFC